MGSGMTMGDWRCFAAKFTQIFGLWDKFRANFSLNLAKNSRYTKKFTNFKVKIPHHPNSAAKIHAFITLKTFWLTIISPLKPSFLKNSQTSFS